MAALGKAVRSAVSSGRHETTKGMRKTRSIGQDIEWWWKVNEVQIPGTKNALYRGMALPESQEACTNRARACGRGTVIRGYGLGRRLRTRGS